MQFLIVLSGLFAGLAGMAALFIGEYAAGFVMITAAVLIVVMGLDAFS